MKLSAGVLVKPLCASAYTLSLCLSRVALRGKVLPLRVFVFTSVCLVALILSGCSTPSEGIARQADSFGFVSEVVVAQGFEHQIYRKPLVPTAKDPVLHVYLEGDGRPWLRPTLIAQDPTSRSPLMLKLMAEDTQPSLYLGRPCYHGYYNNSLCHPELWTTARYSETVVASMAEVLELIIAEEQIKGLVIFGHSGGATLAVLLAARMSETLAVVTLAGNLDIDAWAAGHDYAPLTGSLNPATSTILNPDIRQLHLVGGEDENVEREFVTAFVSRQKNAQLVEKAEYDHACCWQQVWPQVLAWSAAIGSEKNASGVAFESFLALPQ